jgi:hypothetical protein
MRRSPYRPSLCREFIVILLHATPALMSGREVMMSAPGFIIRFRNAEVKRSHHGYHQFIRRCSTPRGRIINRPHHGFSLFFDDDCKDDIIFAAHVWIMSNRLYNVSNNTT